MSYIITNHLDDDDIRNLVKYCVKNSILKPSCIIKESGCNPGNFYSWVNHNKSSPASVTASREVFESFFKTQDCLPVDFRHNHVDHVQKFSEKSSESSEKQESTESSETSECTRWSVKPILDILEGLDSSYDSSETLSDSNESQEEEISLEKKECSNNNNSTCGVLVRIGSWNLKNIGQSTPKEKKLRISALVTQQHIVAVQEVRCHELLQQLKTTGSEKFLQGWNFIQNDLSGKCHRRECMGFFYNTNVLDLLHNTDFSNNKIANDLRYKPFAATFSIVGNPDKKFTLVNIHIKYSADVKEKSLRNNTKSRVDEEERVAEIMQILQILHWMQIHTQSFSNEIYICGDFNLEPNHTVYKKFREKNMRESINARHKTTVSEIPKSYDNIWVPNNSKYIQFHLARVGILNDLVVAHDKKSRKEFRQNISDHLPVFTEAHF